MDLELAQSRTYPVSVERAFDVVLPTPLPELFSRRYAALPPIREVRDQDGEWGTLGQTRTIVLADRGTMRETLTSVDRPHSFGYRISDITGPMKPLAASVDGLLDASSEAGTGVRITWAWTVRPGLLRGGPADAGVRPDVAGLRPPRARADRAGPGRLTPRSGRFGNGPRLVLTFPTASPGTRHGAVAQLVARLVRNEKVRGSNPLSSTM